MKINKINLTIFVFLFSVLLVSAQQQVFSGGTGGEFSTGNSYVNSNPQFSQPGFTPSIYAVGGNPLIENEFNYAICEARQDFIIQIPVGGCSPNVVRSDLLAEQDVPVFCKLQAIQINPAVSAEYVRNMRFTSQGGYPEGVSGVSYYPARDALKARENSQGFPTLDNIGYAVITLRRNPNENNMPDLITGNLSAKIEYDSPNAFGFGIYEKSIPILSDEEWAERYKEFAFFDGHGYLRVDSIEADRVEASIYSDKDRIIRSLSIIKGQQSNEIYLPGFYCSAGFSLTYKNGVVPKTKATINLDGEEYDVRQGESFADNKCRVTNIKDTGFGTGQVTVSCTGDRPKTLTIAQKNVILNFDGQDDSYAIGTKVFDASDGTGGVYLAGYNEQSNEISFVKTTGTFNPRNTFNGPSSGTAKVEKGKTGDVFGKQINFVDFEAIIDIPSNSQNFEDAFFDSINNYELTEADYGDLEFTENIGEENNENLFGVKSLREAIKLATGKQKEATRLELTQRLNEKYDLGSEELLNVDSSRANSYFTINGKIYPVTLERITPPNYDDIQIRINVNGNRVIVHNEKEHLVVPETRIKEVESLGENYINAKNTEEIYVSNFDENSVTITSKCPSNEPDKGGTKTIKLGEQDLICGHNIYVEDIFLNQEVNIRLNPVVRDVGSIVNFSYGIGIEERAIKLSPEKAQERIDRLTENIEKWGRINDNLGKLVEGGKAACFATSAALQVKNLFSGLGGEALARNEVMTTPEVGWNSLCEEAVSTGKISNGMAQGPYSSIDDCLIKNNDNINRDVNSFASFIKEDNERIKSIEGPLTEQSGFLGGKSVDSDKSYEQFVNGTKSQLSDRLKDQTILKGDGKTPYDLTRVIEKTNAESIGNYDNAKELELYSEVLADDKSSETQKALARKKLSDIFERVDGYTSDEEKASYSSIAKSSGDFRGNIRLSNLRSKEARNPELYDNGEVLINGNYEEAGLVPYTDETTGETKYYAVTLDKRDERNYISKEVYTWDEKTGKVGSIVSDDVKKEILLDYPTFIKTNSGNYNNEIRQEDRVVRYYEVEPYKGMPAYVPVDVNKGWYAATKQILPAFGNVQAYQDSGRVSSFWICNVGSNNKAEFEFGFGDDDCQQFNGFTGQPTDQVLGLQESEARRLVQDAQRALESAASAYKAGAQQVKISSGTFKVGNSMASISSARCTDFMSPSDCKLMFNVCDPVICPSSRCNLGGTYYVDDVVQSGIVGSTLLCLPNVNEGIYVPVCLTGIHAGIDNYLSILEASKSCLQENIETGRYVGICDEITAIYQCEFFWRQVAPATKAIIPKLLDRATGVGSARGGGEYLNTQAAWSNTQESVSYFKNVYGVNALKAFNLRSTEEAGGQFCKAFVSTRFPKNFDSLIKPDSPTQFSAWFDEIPLSSVEVLGRSQYKVYYHIFAGNDAGTYYSIYLRGAPGSAGVQDTGSLLVDTGYVARGEFVDLTRDLQGIKGFKELCVRINDKEECGFQRVSTSFALNYVNDKYIQQQATTPITSERACVSGTPSALSLINPNVQTGVENSITPEIYNNGIIRVCSTTNPGLTTEPGRWTRVGHCGDTAISCWIDENSVKNSITAGNKGVLNSTITELDEFAESQEVRTEFLAEQEKINKELEEVETGLKDLSILTQSINRGDSQDVINGVRNNINQAINKIDEVENARGLSARQNALVLYYRANAYNLLAELEYKFVETKGVEEVKVTEPGTTVTPPAVTPEVKAGAIEIISLTEYTGEVPEIMKNLFAQVDANTNNNGISYTLAAISLQECGEGREAKGTHLWYEARNNPQEFDTWIRTRGTPPEGRACNWNNGYNVYGPMQFQVGTKYLEEHGFKDIKTVDPNGKSLPRTGTWEEYAPRVAEILGVPESEVSPLNVIDSMYAAALKLNKDAGNPMAWSEPQVTLAAERYYGSCPEKIGFNTYNNPSGNFNYCEEVFKTFSALGYGEALGDKPKSETPQNGNGEIVSSNCVLRAASWSPTRVASGTEVKLSVSGLECEGEEISFDIIQDDGAIDDYSGITLNAIFENGFAVTSWKTDKSDDLYGESEYVFKAYIKGHRDKTITSRNELKVY